MELRERNLTLIGMPGAGKTSIGEALAIALSVAFLDTDRLIEARCRCTLQEVIDRAGLELFRRTEEEVILSLGVREHVIATGGSVVYSPRAMAHLRSLGWVVWLDLPLQEIEKRLRDGLDRRGIVRSPEQSLGALYEERRPLYARHSHMAVRVEDKTDPQVVEEILRWLEKGCAGR